MERDKGFETAGSRWRKHPTMLAIPHDVAVPQRFPTVLAPDMSPRELTVRDRSRGGGVGGAARNREPLRPLQRPLEECEEPLTRIPGRSWVWRQVVALELDALPPSRESNAAVAPG